MNLCLIIFLLVEICTAASFSDSDEEFYSPEIKVNPCHKNDWRLNDCVKDFLQNLMSQLQNGSAEWNLSPMEPFIIPSHRYRMVSNALQAIFVPKNAEVHGLTKTEFRKVKIDMNATTVEMRLETFTPKVFMQGTYKADVKLTDIKARPVGIFNITLVDVDNIATVLGDFEYINGDKHLRLRKFHIAPSFDHFEFYASGINPDPKINDVYVAFVNMYWRDMKKVLVKDSRYLWEPMYLEELNKFLTFTPFKRIISDI